MDSFVYAKLLRIIQKLFIKDLTFRSYCAIMQLNPRTYPMFEGKSEKYIRSPWNIFDSIRRQREREKLERIRRRIPESRRNSFQEISNRRSATPTWLFLAIPQDILPFPSHFVQFLSNFLPIHFLAYSRVYERNFFVNC